MKFICLLLFLGLADALKCYSGGFTYDRYSGTREGEAELVECSSHHDACVIVGKKNMPEDVIAPFTVYELQCGFSTADRLLIGLRHRDIYPDIYKQNLLDKCIYTDTGENTPGIICFCNTDRCNDIVNYHQPQTCYRGETGRPNPNTVKPGDFEIRFDGDFEPPEEVVCGLGGCAEFTAFAKYDSFLKDDEIEVSNDIENVWFTNKFVTCYHKCSKGVDVSTGNPCFNTTFFSAPRDVGYLSVQVCCCEDELCNRKGKNWSTTSSPSSSDSDEDLLWWFR